MDMMQLAKDTEVDAGDMMLIREKPGQSRLPQRVEVKRRTDTFTEGLPRYWHDEGVIIMNADVLENAEPVVRHVWICNSQLTGALHFDATGPARSFWWKEEKTDAKRGSREMKYMAPTWAGNWIPLEHVRAKYFGF
jgi:hypothetical protein